MKYNFTHALGDLCRNGVMLKRNILVQTMYGLWIGASFKSVNAFRLIEM